MVPLPFEMNKVEVQAPKLPTNDPIFEVVNHTDLYSTVPIWKDLPAINV